MPLRYGPGPASFEINAKRRTDYIAAIRNGRRRPFCITPMGYVVPRIHKTETCWLWTGAKTRGYGSQGVANRRYLVHRLMWQWTYGPIPDGLDVLHHCDNPPCVRPEHLFLGTAKDNADDAMRKGRLSIGSRQPRAKLTEAKVLEIRQRLAAGETLASIGRRYGVSVSNIAMIRDGLRWKQVAA